MKKVIVLLIISCSFSCVKQDQGKKELKDIAREIVVTSKNCALITVDSLGIAQARTMDPFPPEEDFIIWMATNPKSRKVKEIEHNPNVTLYYFDKDDPGYVTIYGTATLVNAQEEKQRFWKEEWKNFYKNRTTDYLLIKVVPSKLNVISEQNKILGDSITWKPAEVEFK